MKVRHITSCTGIEKLHFSLLFMLRIFGSMNSLIGDKTTCYVSQMCSDAYNLDITEIILLNNNQG